MRRKNFDIKGEPKVLGPLKKNYFFFHIANLKIRKLGHLILAYT